MNYSSNRINAGASQFSFTLDGRDWTTYRYIMKGQVFAREAAVIEKELNKIAGTGSMTIIINMNAVKAFSSAGIRVILAAYKKMRKSGGTLKLQNPSETVKNVFGMAALDELLLK